MYKTFSYHRKHHLTATWSACTVETMQEKLLTVKICLTKLSPLSEGRGLVGSVLTTSNCGNSLVEGSEDCDCGLPSVCKR